MKESPFPFLGIAHAYRFASRTFPSNEALAPTMARVETWLLARGPGEQRPGHDCYSDPDCWVNWKLVRALAVAELLDAPPPGNAPAGSWLADRAGGREWVRETVNTRAPSAVGPQPFTTWAVGAGGV
ncbi:MAG: hypothetical protein WCO96_10390, partial [Actinomycetes bacterium]